MGLTKELTQAEKRKLLATYTQLMVQGGYNITFIFGHALNSFNYDIIKESTQAIKKELGLEY